MKNRRKINKIGVYMRIEASSVISQQSWKQQKYKNCGTWSTWETVAPKHTSTLTGASAQFRDCNHFNYKETSFLVSWIWFPHGPSNLLYSQRVSIKLITMSNIKFFKRTSTCACEAPGESQREAVQSAPSATQCAHLVRCLTFTTLIVPVDCSHKNMFLIL